MWEEGITLLGSREYLQEEMDGVYVRDVGPGPVAPEAGRVLRGSRGSSEVTVEWEKQVWMVDVVR